MLEAISLFAPPLIALRFYSHLQRDKLSSRSLIMSYGVFVIFINLCMYLSILYLFGATEVVFDDKSFVNYVLAASILAVIIPFVVNLIETTISVDVKRNVWKK